MHISLITNLAGIVISQILNLCASLLLFRILGESCFGYFVWGSSAFIMLTAIIGAPLTLAATKFTSEKNADYYSICYALDRFAIFGGIGTALIACLICIPLSAQIRNVLEPNYFNWTIAVAFFSILVLIENKKCVFAGVILGSKRFLEDAFLKVLDAFIILLFSAIGATCFGLRGALAGYAAGVAARYVCYRFAYQRCWAIFRQGSGSSKKNKEIYKFILISSLCGIAVTPIAWIASTRLLTASNSSTVSVYTILNQWRSTAMILASSANAIFLPSISATCNSRSYTGKHLLLIIVSASMVAVGSLVLLFIAPIIFSFYSISPPLVYHAFGVLLITNVLTSICNSVGVIFTSKGGMRQILALNVCWCAVYIAMLYLFDCKSILSFCYAIFFSYLLHSFVLLACYVLWEKAADFKR